jgi:hypothetical protein
MLTDPLNNEPKSNPWKEDSMENQRVSLCDNTRRTERVLQRSFRSGIEATFQKLTQKINFIDRSLIAFDAAVPVQARRIIDHHCISEKCDFANARSEPNTAPIYPEHSLIIRNRLEKGNIPDIDEAFDFVSRFLNWTIGCECDQFGDDFLVFCEISVDRRGDIGMDLIACIIRKSLRKCAFFGD